VRGRGKASAGASGFVRLDGPRPGQALRILPWAHYALGIPAVKLHVGLDHGGYLPAFVTVSLGKTSDIEVGRCLRFPQGSLVAFDKGYTDYRWFEALTDGDIFFVTRTRKNATWRVAGRRRVDRSTGLSCDQTIASTC